MSEDLSFHDWLEHTEENRDRLFEAAKSPLPTDIGERHVALEQGINYCDEAGRLLADAESYLTMMTAQSVMLVREQFPDLTADERKAMVKDHVAKIQHIVDALSVTRSSLKDRLYVMQNMNRARP